MNINFADASSREKKNASGSLSRAARLRAVLLASSALVSALLPGTLALADDAIWLANTNNNDFNNNANWNTGAVPTGEAAFGASANLNSFNFTKDTTLGSLLLTPEAGNYTFNVQGGDLTFTGAGITVNGGSVTLNTNGNNITFKNDSTAANATINNSGGISFLDRSTAGQATIVSNASLELHDKSKLGTAHVTNNGNGRMTFFNESSAEQSTITMNDNSIVSFLDSSKGGTAQFRLNQNAKIDISELATDGTTVGSIDGGGTLALGAKNLAVGGNNLSTIFFGVISGIGGSLTKEGTGTLTLGSGTYTGATVVKAGTLVVDGTIESSSGVTVNDGATLAGRGKVSDTVIKAGGTLAPGDGPGAIGTLFVQGNLTLAAAATYLLQVTPEKSGLTDVKGTAQLGGAGVTANFAPGSYISKQYLILIAEGGLNGTFGTLTTVNLPASFTAQLKYAGNGVDLDLSLDVTDPGPGGDTGFNTNQRNVRKALSNSFHTVGGIPMVFGALFGSPAGLTQISGETATGTQQATFDAMTMFMGLMTDPHLAGRGDRAASEPALQYADGARGSRGNDPYATMFRKAPAAERFAPHWSMWAAGYGGSQTTRGDAELGSNSTTSRVFGGAAGADYHLSLDTVAGFALAGGGTTFSVANGGSGSSDLFQAGAFVRHMQGPSYLTAALAYGWQDVTTTRTLHLAGADQLRAHFNTNAVSGRLEGGYRFNVDGHGLTPYAAGQFTTYMLPSYAEQVENGTNLFALSYDAKDVTAARSEVGLRTDRTLALSDTLLTLRGRLAWAHDFNQDRAIAASFQSLPASAFVVNGARPAADSALTTASAELSWMSGWSASATFEGEFSDTTRSYAGKGGLRYAW